VDIDAGLWRNIFRTGRVRPGRGCEWRGGVVVCAGHDVPAA